MQDASICYWKGWLVPRRWATQNRLISAVDKREMTANWGKGEPRWWVIPLNNSYMGLDHRCHPGLPLLIRDRLHCWEAVKWWEVVLTISMVKSSCLDREQGYLSRKGVSVNDGSKVFQQSAVYQVNSIKVSITLLLYSGYRVDVINRRVRYYPE